MIEYKLQYLNIISILLQKIYLIFLIINFRKNMGGLLSFPILTEFYDRSSTSKAIAGGIACHGARENNEDAHNIELNIIVEDKRSVDMLGVYDGHGGASAAAFLAKTLPEYVKKLSVESILQAGKDLTDMIHKIDEEFLKLPDRAHGSTCVLAFIVHDKDIAEYADLVVVNIGDSRAAIMTPEPNEDIIARIAPTIHLLTPKQKARVNEKLEKFAATLEKEGLNTKSIFTHTITEDHNPTDEAETERITLAGGFVKHARVDGSLALSRAIGDADYKELKAGKTHQRVISTPTIYKRKFKKNDILILFCDGLVETLCEPEFDYIMHEQLSIFKNGYLDFHEYDIALIPKYLIAGSIIAGSTDNHTCIAYAITQNASKYVKNFPKKQYVPGPYFTRGTPNFQKAYREDFQRNGYDFEKEKDLIKLFEDDVSNFGIWGDFYTNADEFTLEEDDGFGAFRFK